MPDTGRTQPISRHGAADYGPAGTDDLRIDTAPPPPADGPGAVRSDLGAAGTHKDRPDPVEAVAKSPDNRAKLLLAIAALTLLNFLLLVATLSMVADDAGEPVVVDGVPCLIADHEGESVLYCRR